MMILRFARANAERCLRWETDMKSSRFFLVPLVLVSAFGVLQASAQEFKAGSLVISQPWSRATAGGAKVGAGYMTITNIGTEPDRLIGGSLPQAGKFEVHEMRMENNVMTMRPLHGGLEIKPGQTVKLAPGGYHVMFMRLKEPLKQGEVLKGELVFEKAGKVPIEYKVGTIAAGAPPSAMPAH
jgi:copper(I)-binding protein